MNISIDPTTTPAGPSLEGYLGCAHNAAEAASAMVEERLAMAEWEAQTTAGVMDILTRVENSERLEQGCATLVNEFQKITGCRRVALGICGRHPESFRLLVVSGQASIDRRSENAHAIEAVLAEAVLRSDLTVWPGDSSASNYATFAHRRLYAQSETSVIVSSPLRNEKGNAVAAWVFLGTKEFADKPLTLNLLRACEPHMAASLDLLRRSEYNLLHRWFHNLAEHRRKLLYRSLIIAAVALFLVLWIPWPYSMDCKCKLQPISRRFVAAPYEGILEKSLVEAGDVIERNQTLARMDGREIRLAISESTSELKRAEVKRNVQLAKQDQGAAKMAALEIERLDLKVQLLESRSKKLEIKSPVRGIVIRGDQKRAEGMPVTLGQNLFEVAPLDKMLVEIAISDRDFPHAQVGQKVHVKLDAYPGKSLEGTLTRIHPRAEEWDSDYVFVGEITVDNPNELLRPGMNGNAVIRGERHTLYWNLFHKPWENLMMFGGW